MFLSVFKFCACVGVGGGGGGCCCLFCFEFFVRLFSASTMVVLSIFKENKYFLHPLGGQGGGGEEGEYCCSIILYLSFFSRLLVLFVWELAIKQKMSAVLGHRQKTKTKNEHDPIMAGIIIMVHSTFMCSWH